MFNYVSLFLLLLYFITLTSSNKIFANQIFQGIPSRFDRDRTNSYIRKILGRENLPTSTDCKRTCIQGENRLCYYQFNIEHYQAMGVACGNCFNGTLKDCFLPQCVTADGIEKGATTINRRIPGPLIEVCQGDLVVIDAINMMHSDSTTIHWHGILQKGTPYSDGVPYVTQCPILPMTTFRYVFWAEDIGTYFYHSHSGMQKYNGLFGGLIVRAPASVEFSSKSEFSYDVDDNVIVVSDWSHDVPEMFMVGLPFRLPGPFPEAILINGKGKFFDPIRNAYTNSPYEIIYVKKSKSNRIRIISSTSLVCPFELRIQNHRMKIIATDGSPVSPVYVDTLTFSSGERYDIILKADQPSDVYWINTRLVGLCTDFNITQWAILSYRADVQNADIPNNPIISPNRGIVFNEINIPCGNSANDICLSDLTNPFSSNLGTARVDKRFYFNFGFRNYDLTTFFAAGTYEPFWNTLEQMVRLPTVNGLNFQTPISPILSQPEILKSSGSCNIQNIPNTCTNNTICRCTHIVTVKKNSVIEIILIDEETETIAISHPIHIHGFKFAVMSEGIIPTNGSLTIDRVKNLYESGQLRPFNKNPPIKDTIPLANQGYAIIRFVADNPGAWLIHCHIEDHMVFGMEFVFAVQGSIPAPPRNFPQCGNFLYD